METPVADDLFQFIADCWQNQCNLEILLFLGKHPCTRFDCRAIAQASAIRGADVQRALSNLINRRLVEAHGDNSTQFYALTKDEPRRSLVLRIVAISRHHWQLTLRQIDQRYKQLGRVVPSLTASA